MPDLDIKIDLEKTGTGAQQAKQELDAVKESAQQVSSTFEGTSKAQDKSSESASNLHFKLIGFRTILSSVSMMARGGADAVTGFGRALGGVVMVLSNTAWGKIAMIVATLLAIGVSIYQSFKPAKAALDETADAAGNLKEKLPKDLGEPGITNAIEFAKQLTEQFDKATAAAERTRKSMDELSDANLALKLANIDRDVASGSMSEDQGKQARIEARLAHEQEKITREKVTVQEKVAAGEKTIAQTEESYRGVEAGITQTEAEIRQRGKAPGFPMPVDQFPSDKKAPLSTSRFVLAMRDILLPGYDPNYQPKTDQGLAEKQREFIEINALQKRLAAQKKEAADRLKAYDTTREKISPEIESGKARLGTLDVLSQVAEVTASGQSVAVASSMARAKDEAEAKQAADRAAYNAQVQAEQERRREALARDAKVQAGDRAGQILDLQRAEEESAQSQLRAAEKAVGAKGLSSRERAQAKQGLSLAQSRFSQEQSDVVQASALQGKIRNAVTPDDVAKLLQALESIGNAFKTVANAADNQASQIKNGGLRIK